METILPAFFRKKKVWERGENKRTLHFATCKEEEEEEERESKNFAFKGTKGKKNYPLTVQFLSWFGVFGTSLGSVVVVFLGKKPCIARVPGHHCRIKIGSRGG